MPVNLNGSLFARYRPRYSMMVETGSFLGEGIQAGLNAEFSHIVSIELDPEYYARTTMQFFRHNRVKCLFGKSEEWLPRILGVVNTDILFWLDAHQCKADGVGTHSAIQVRRELEAILQCGVKHSVLLIDDVNDQSTMRAVEDTIRGCVPNQEIEILDGESPDGRITYQTSIAVIQL